MLELTNTELNSLLKFILNFHERLNEKNKNFILSFHIGSWVFLLSYLLKCIKDGRNILNEDEQYIQTEEDELPDDYQEFQEKIDSFYN